MLYDRAFYIEIIVKFSVPFSVPSSLPSVSLNIENVTLIYWLRGSQMDAVYLSTVWLVCSLQSQI